MLLDSIMGFTDFFNRQQNAGLLLTRGFEHRWDYSMTELAFLSQTRVARPFPSFSLHFCRRQHDEHRPAFHLGRLFNRAYIVEGCRNFLKIFESDLRVIHLAATELDSHADF